MLISYFATLREFTRKREEPWPTTPATVRALLGELVAAYGEEFASWVLPDGQSLGLSIVLVNGKDVRSLQGLDTPLQDSDHVFIFPPVAGG